MSLAFLENTPKFSFGVFSKTHVSGEQFEDVDSARRGEELREPC